MFANLPHDAERSSTPAQVSRYEVPSRRHHQGLAKPLKSSRIQGRSSNDIAGELHSIIG
jgi:hypothetical protein